MRRLQFVLALLIIAVILSGCGQLFPDDSDQAAFDSLREAGSDLTKSHPFDFYIYHPEEAGARQICSEQRTEGFQVSVREGAIEGEWLCLASFNLVTSIDKLTELAAMFDKLTSQYGGEYDGWETIVIP